MEVQENKLDRPDEKLNDDQASLKKVENND